MTPELKAFYEQQFDLFLHPGWADFLEDLSKVKAPLENIMTVADAHSLAKRQGQLDILNWVLNRKQMIEAAFKDLEADE